MLFRSEARGRIFEFDMFDWWRVVIDGAVFTDIGRVFLPGKDLAFQGGDPGSLKTTDEVRVSGGGGLRFALSEAILIRLDAGFSEEETGLIYLTFGQTF